MSIYDQSEEQPITATSVEERPASQPSKPKKKRSGCGSCLVVCLGMMLILLIACGIAGWVVVKKAPDWARDAIVAVVDGSDLADEDKQIVNAQVDRVITEYKAGRISMDQLAAIGKEVSESPVFTLTVAMAAEEAYIEPSGLSDDEKSTAKRTLQRVARGVFEESIDPDDLNSALNYISTNDGNGSRQFKSSASDEDVRQMLTECKRLADTEEVPDESYEVNFGEEFKAAIDRALTS